LPETIAPAYLALSSVEMMKKGWRRLRDKSSSLLGFIITDEEGKKVREGCKGQTYLSYLVFTSVEM
jgi:hypothetical protein